MLSFLKAYKYAPHLKKWLLLNLITSIVGNGLILLTPLYIGFAVDNMIGLGNVDFSLVVINLIITASLYTGGVIFIYIAQFTANYYAIKLGQVIKEGIFNQITNSPISYLDQNEQGDLLVRLTLDVTQILDATTFFYTHFFTSITAILFTIIVLFMLNIWLTIVIVLMVPTMYFYTKYFSRKTNLMFQKIQKNTSDLTTLAQETFDQREIINVFNYQNIITNEFQTKNDELYEMTKKGYFLASMNNPSFRLIQNISYALLGLVYIVLFINNLAPAVGTFMSIIMYSSLFAKPINELSAVSQQFLLGSASFNRVSENLISNNTEESGTIIPTKVAGEFKFLKLDYEEEPNNLIIKNLNLKIEPGTKVAIVGPSGSGKSSLVSLLMRFAHPTRGTIELDAVNISDYQITEYRKLFGLVLQNPWNFNATIADNIRYGKLDAKIEEVIIAAKMANVHDFIMQYATGYDTILDEGLGLSMGQQQLLTIARVILADPAIYILDEATSYVDSLIDQKIQETIDQITKNKTTFIVAHRLKTIINADLIIVLDQGEIVEFGTHEKLLKNKKIYNELYESQFID